MARVCLCTWPALPAHVVTFPVGGGCTEELRADLVSLAAAAEEERLLVRFVSLAAFGVASSLDTLALDY